MDDAREALRTMESLVAAGHVSRPFVQHAEALREAIAARAP
ncbi:MAG TPA: hypothetical protein VFQ45_13735 [Longimicrobium sp.]|nr:hypothetical protein [Longimicrobium sp.]